MANKTAFSAVTVDNASRPREKFNFNRSFSSTMPFGWVGPMMVQKMVPNSKHIVKSRELLRLDPMVAPVSQGQIECKIHHSFIGMSDLFRNFQKMLVDQPYALSTGVGHFENLPMMRLRDLSVLVLVGCKFQVYVRPGLSVNGLDPWYDMSGDAAARSALTSLFTSSFSVSSRLLSINSPYYLWTQNTFPNYLDAGNVINVSVNASIFGSFLDAPSTLNQFYIPTANVGLSDDSVLYSNHVSLAEADYVITRKDLGQTSVTIDGNSVNEVGIAIKLSDFGKRLNHILDVCGYGVDFLSDRYVDLSRLFALYMAYYGAYGLSKYNNYESTNCALFLNQYEQGANSFNPISLFASGSTSFGDQYFLNFTFVNFICDLVLMFETSPVDYISSHRTSDTTNVSDYGFLDNIVVSLPNSGSTAFGTPGTGTEDYKTSPQMTSNAIYINKVSHTQVDADLLKLLYKTVNRQTVAGRRIAELLRAGGYGQYVDEQQSHYIGNDSFVVDIADVNATSDSTSAAGNTSILGGYVGKGVGAKQAEKSFTYETDEFGYWITLCVISPDSSYCQGNDQTVFDVDRYGQYNREYDSLGYEMQDKHVVYNDAPWQEVSTTNADLKLDQSFGLVPREMRYKVGRSVITGGFARRSTRDDRLPFILNKYLDFNNKVVEAVTTGSYGTRYEVSTTAFVDRLPVAGDVWRYINRFPWLANFERIFAYSGKMPAGYLSAKWMSRYLYCNFSADYFMLFAYVMYDCYAPMLPIADSYSTTDDNDGHGKTMSVA